jgi:hypothetical protein
MPRVDEAKEWERELLEDPDSAMREFIEFATGDKQAKNANVRNKQVLFTDDLMRSLAGRGLATVLYHCKRGSLKAAIYLVDRCLGVPDQPFQQEVSTMTKEEAEAALFAEFKAQGFTDEVARGLVEASRRPAPGYADTTPQ